MSTAGVCPGQENRHSIDLADHFDTHLAPSVYRVRLQASARVAYGIGPIRNIDSAPSTRGSASSARILELLTRRGHVKGH